MATEKQVAFIQDLLNKEPRVDTDPRFAVHNKMRQALRQHVASMELEALSNQDASTVIDALKSTEARTVARNAALFGDVAAAYAKLIDRTLKPPPGLLIAVADFLGDKLVEFTTTLQPTFPSGLAQKLSEFTGRNLVIVGDEADLFKYAVREEGEN